MVSTDFDKYYVDLSSVRNTETVQNITTKLEFHKPGDFCSILFTGHRGCGKSTELGRIQKQLKSEFHIIYLETDIELDINDVEYTDIYLLIIKKVADELYKIGAQFDRELLTSFESWFKEITEETEESVEKAISLQTDAEAGFKIPFISKLLTKLTAQIKGSDKQKKVIRQTLQKDISRLQADINLLLNDAYNKLRKKEPQHKKGFLIILDNLDRVPPNVGNHLFFDYATQLQILNTTVIFAFERITTNEYYSVLAQVCLTKNIDKDEIGQSLLFNLSVLEYNGNNRWNYINPVFKSSSLFQEALSNEQQRSQNS